MIPFHIFLVSSLRLLSLSLFLTFRPKRKTLLLYLSVVGTGLEGRGRYDLDSSGRLEEEGAAGEEEGDCEASLPPLPVSPPRGGASGGQRRCLSRQRQCLSRGPCHCSSFSLSLSFSFSLGHGAAACGRCFSKEKKPTFVFESKKGTVQRGGPGKQTLGVALPLSLLQPHTLYFSSRG